VLAAAAAPGGGGGSFPWDSPTLHPQEIGIAASQFASTAEARAAIIATWPGWAGDASAVERDETILFAGSPSLAWSTGSVYGDLNLPAPVDRVWLRFAARFTGSLEDQQAGNGNRPFLDLSIQPGYDPYYSIGYNVASEKWVAYDGGGPKVNFTQLYAAIVDQCALPVFCFDGPAGKIYLFLGGELAQTVEGLAPTQYDNIPIDANITALNANKTRVGLMAFLPGVDDPFGLFAGTQVTSGESVFTVAPP
jgi:hypothetical protein